MCDFCKGKTKIYSSNNPKEYIIHPAPASDDIIVFYGSGHNNMLEEYIYEINHCPLCGRKLNKAKLKKNCICLNNKPVITAGSDNIGYFEIINKEMVFNKSKSTPTYFNINYCPICGEYLYNRTL